MTDEPLTEEEINRRANEKAAKRKAARAKMMATKTIEKGLLIVHTGKGKGKSTAAFGMVMRCLGHGFRVGVVQFVKGRWETGERSVLARFPDLVTIRTMGEGFTWETQDRARDIAAARAAWEEARRLLADPSYRLVLLDELNIVLRYDYLPVEDVVATLRGRRSPARRSPGDVSAADRCDAHHCDHRNGLSGRVGPVKLQNPVHGRRRSRLAHAAAFTP